MSRRAGFELPAAVAPDRDRRHVGAVGVQRLEPGACGRQRDLVLARAAAGDQCEAQLALRSSVAHGVAGGVVAAVSVCWTSRPTVSVITVPAGALSPAPGLCVITTPSSEPSVVSW